MGYCNRNMDDAPGIRADCNRHLKSGKRCEDCPHRDIHQEVRDLRQESERLKGMLREALDAHYMNGEDWLLLCSRIHSALDSSSN